MASERVGRVADGLAERGGRRVGRARVRRAGLIAAGALTVASGGLAGCGCQEGGCEQAAYFLATLDGLASRCCRGVEAKVVCYNLGNLTTYGAGAAKCFTDRCRQMSRDERNRFRDKLFERIPEFLRALIPQLNIRIGLGNNIPPDVLIVGDFGQRAGALGYNNFPPLGSVNATVSLNMTAVPLSFGVDSVVDAPADGLTMTEEAGDEYAPPADGEGGEGPVVGEAGGDGGQGPIVTDPIVVDSYHYILVGGAESIEILGGVAPGRYALVQGEMGIADYQPHPQGGAYAVPSEFRAMFYNGTTAVELYLDRTCPYNKVTIRSDGVGVFAALMEMHSLDRNEIDLASIMPRVWVEIPLTMTAPDMPLVISTSEAVPAQAVFPWLYELSDGEQVALNLAPLSANDPTNAVNVDQNPGGNEQPNNPDPGGSEPFPEPTIVGQHAGLSELLELQPRPGTPSDSNPGTTAPGGGGGGPFTPVPECPTFLIPPWINPGDLSNPDLVPPNPLFRGFPSCQECVPNPWFPPGPNRPRIYGALESMYRSFQFLFRQCADAGHPVIMPEFHSPGCEPAVTVDGSPQP